MNSHTVLTLVAVSAAAFAGGQAQQPQPADVPAAVVRAQRFELVDQNGNVRGSIGFGETGYVTLQLRDTSGHTKAQLSVTDDGVVDLDMTAGPRQRRAHMRASSDGWPGASLALYGGGSEAGAMATAGGAEVWAEKLSERRTIRLDSGRGKERPALIMMGGGRRERRVEP